MCVLFDSFKRRSVIFFKVHINTEAKFPFYRKIFGITVIQILTLVFMGFDTSAPINMNTTG